jgi:hypothetical protein
MFSPDTPRAAAPQPAPAPAPAPAPPLTLAPPSQQPVQDGPTITLRMLQTPELRPGGDVERRDDLGDKHDDDAHDRGERDSGR